MRVDGDFLEYLEIALEENADEAQEVPESRIEKARRSESKAIIRES
jgi:hypothetical protein